MYDAIFRIPSNQYWHETLLETAKKSITRYHGRRGNNLQPPPPPPTSFPPAVWIGLKISMTSKTSPYSSFSWMISLKIPSGKCSILLSDKSLQTNTYTENSTCIWVQSTVAKKMATGTFTHNSERTKTLKALIKTQREVLKTSNLPYTTMLYLQIMIWLNTLFLLDNNLYLNR